MRKSLLVFIILCLLLIIVKFRLSNYNIEYKLNNYSIKTIYKNKRFYYEINDGERIYNFDIYKSRNFNYSKITSIKEITGDNYQCIYPTIKDTKTYPLCYVGEEYTDYNLIDSEELESYKYRKNDNNKSDKDFVYFNNLSDEEYIALWNYKGYIVMHKDSYDIKDLFKSDKYDNTIAYLIDDTLYTSNNDMEHEYDSLISLNLTNLKTNKIDLGVSIDYDSYVVGNIKKMLYIFDNKHSILYEINIKNGKTKIIGDNSIGYVKYENGDFVNCSKSEYKVNHITYNNKESNYKYSVSDALYKTINNNSKIKQKIYNDKVNIISENKNNIYYLDKDTLYRYNPLNGYEKVFYNYELSFNSNNTIFIFNK